jgi:uncharacterized membrane protein
MQMTSFDPVYQALAAVGYTDPLHPPLTHFPIALTIAALLFGLAALALKRPLLKISAQHCLVLAWLFFFPTVFLGLTDWQHYYQGAWLFPIVAKMWLAGLLFLLLSLGVILVWTGRGESKAILAIYILSFFTVVALGYFGGRLVFGGQPPSSPRRAQINKKTLGEGEKVFAANCLACHPQGKNSIMAQYPLKGSDELANFDGFLAFIRAPRLDNGAKGPMPDFPPSRISETQARDLYQYLRTAFGQPGQSKSEHKH